MSSNSRESHLVYRCSGDGPTPIVFVHGFCQSSAYWERSLLELPTGFRGYGLDLPGFGKSRRVPGPYDLPSLADSVNAFMVANRLQGVFLVGNSMGGVVCQLVALLPQHPLSRLILVSTGPGVRDAAASRAAAKQHAEQVWDWPTASALVGRFFARSVTDFDHFVEIAMMADKQARIETNLSMATTELLPDLVRISVPTLIVQGQLDTLRTPEVGARMASKIPHGKIHVMTGVGHTPMVEDPVTWERIFHEFISTPT